MEGPVRIEDFGKSHDVPGMPGVTVRLARRHDVAKIEFKATFVFYGVSSQNEADYQADPQRAVADGVDSAIAALRQGLRGYVEEHCK